VFTSRQGRAHIGLAGDAAFLGKACTGAQTPATVWYGDQPRGACAALLRENSAMSDTPTLFTARTEPEPLQVDAWSHEPLLLSLEMGGANWPSSCRSGSCRTCIGQLQSGRVRYTMEWPGLTPEEHAQGYVLPCVAHPCTDVVLRQGY
jgi:ferredoxin